MVVSGLLTSSFPEERMRDVVFGLVWMWHNSAADMLMVCARTILSSGGATIFDVRMPTMAHKIAEQRST